MNSDSQQEEFYLAAMASRSENSLFTKDVKGSRTYNTSIKSPVNGELNNIGKGVSPFEDNPYGVSIKDAIELCQKAYWNVAIFRSTIDIQSEFSNSKLHFKSANKRSANFFRAWYEKINGWSLGERFFREWFRSGNVFLFRFDGDLTVNDYRKITRAKEEKIVVSKSSKTIPLRYIILNPGDVKCQGAASFVNARYQKVLNSYERERLKNPKTAEEIEFFNSLPEETRRNVKSGSDVVIDLDQEKLTAIFCGKQDYESMAVPMYYAVLPDINLKLEFKKAEQVIARTVDYSVLLITAGDETRSAAKNNELIGLLTELFSSESVGRVLVSDYTTKGEFIIPDLAKIFGSEKYKVVNEDIANGLMNIFWGDEKFANSMVKIQVFLERLNQAREAYLNYFLKPEMKRIAETLGLQEIPEVTFEQINLKEEIEYMKIYTRLAELGILTPEELFDAINSHELPLNENSVESQKMYKSFKDKGLYEPLMKKTTDAGGRPTGTKAPKRVNVGPIGASVSEASEAENFSVSSIGETLKEYFSLRDSIEEEYKKKNGIKRTNKKIKDICNAMAESIFIQENKGDWNKSIEEYVSNPFLLKSNEQTNEVYSLASEHQLSNKLASILLHSRDNTGVINDKE
jgi:hypothetical protein